MTERLSRRNALGAAAAIGVAVPTLAACGSSAGPSSAIDTQTAPVTPTTGATSPAPDGAIAATADIPVGGGVIFQDARVVVTQPEAGTFHGFTIVCTHASCLVNTVTDTINCPCHGSRYSITDGSVVAGPAPAPLTVVPLTVKRGEISKA